MKLARIEHERCGEWAATTYIMVPDELTEDELDKAVLRAQDNWFNDAKAFKESVPASSNDYYHDYSSYPDHMTVREIKKVKEDRKRIYKEWEQLRVRATQSFATYLLREIEGSKYIHDAPVLEGSVNWGHMHGSTIDYGELEDTDWRLKKNYKGKENPFVR